MDSKNIYKILRDWFPELEQYDIPKKQQRADVDTLLNWLVVEQPERQRRRYIMAMDQQQHLENGLSSCALLQDHGININVTQQLIVTRTDPLFHHYEKYKEVIGSHCNLRSQVYDIVLQEIFKLLQALDYEMLLIYGSDYHWMAVPNDQDHIDEFCILFNKQFKDFDKNIEQYQPHNWSWST